MPIHGHRQQGRTQTNAALPGWIPDEMLINYLKSWPLYLLPHHALSRVIYALTRIRSPLAAPVIRWFVRAYSVDLAEAEYPRPREYPSFNAFFTRALRADARPIDTAPEAVVSPVDGTVSAAGAIDAERIFQAKGRDYSLVELLAGEAHADDYRGGRFATLYLSPRDYHRIHMPIDGTLRHMTYIPGRLFSVAPHTVATIPRLFARNERVVAHFDTPAGPMAVVMVGAINVAAIETVWAGLVTPPAGRHVCELSYPVEGETAVRLRRGEELGRFNMGSTVILLFGADGVAWSDNLASGQTVRMGRMIARRT
ncbi:phosphatidylserine decarboxylase [Acidihalobacter prosperus]|uniref:Phosphatidylserine decarboxylase proenzyme n=2 Tax=Acidihalobacter prosperus TaxID=160660 RepID=A0A1A6C7A7_9GAMM|nr:archaetidylserine decarboxylase [Acidihalobacter prosperus]OBS10446.1 phosphatidylserine decarboxylase [Acidihalobacter prosperus]